MKNRLTDKIRKWKYLLDSPNPNLGNQKPTLFIYLLAIMTLMFLFIAIPYFVIFIVVMVFAIWIIKIFISLGKRQKYNLFDIPASKREEGGVQTYFLNKKKKWIYDDED